MPCARGGWSWGACSFCQLLWNRVPCPTLVTEEAHGFILCALPGGAAAAVAVHLAVVEEVAWRVRGRVFRQREAVVATVCALAVSWHWLQGWGVGFLAHASIITI